MPMRNTGGMIADAPGAGVAREGQFRRPPDGIAIASLCG
jgi:hypothetical protein